MPFEITYCKRDADGNEYPVDKDGNRIVEELKLTQDEQYYVDTTPEDWARDKIEEAARYAFYKEQSLLKNHPFKLTPLDKPETVQPRYPLWGNYWAEREFCIMAGDTGVGKSLMAIQIGKHLAGGLVFGDGESVGRPRRVLYIDFELDKESFWARYGEAESTENFFWAGFNTQAEMPRYADSPAEWLLKNLEKQIEETGTQVLIIDQIDRLQIPIGKRTDFMFKLQAITRKHKISTLLVLGTRARNFSKGVELHHIQHSKLYVPFADSVVAIAADFNYQAQRYIKPLKMRNRGLYHAAEVQCYNVYQGENEEYNTSLPPSGYSLLEGDNPSTIYNKEGDFRQGSKLQVILTAMRPEEELLKKSKTRLREEQILKAEALRRDGMTYEYIADDMMLPVSTIKRWVSCIKPKLMADGSNPLHLPKRSAAWGSPTPNPSPKERGFEDLNTDYGMTDEEFVEKPEGMTDEEWAVCVNNPESKNYDAFAFNPYLPEWGDDNS